MHNIDGCVLTREWDAPIVVLSFVASAAGAFVGLTAVVQVLTVRASARRALAAARAFPLQEAAETLASVRFTRWSYVFLLSAAVSLGVSAVWTAHFVGMDALRLYDCAGDSVPFGFDPGWTIGSLVMACGGGLAVINLFIPNMVGGLSSRSVSPDRQSEAATRKSADLRLTPESNDRLTPRARRREELSRGSAVAPLDAHDGDTPRSSTAPSRRTMWPRFVLLTCAIALTAGTMHYGGMQGMLGPFRMEHDALLVAISTLLLIAGASGVSAVSLHPQAGKQLARFEVRVVASFAGALIVLAFHYSAVLGTNFVIYARGSAVGSEAHAGDEGPLSWHFGPSALINFSLTLIVIQLALCHHASEMIAQRSAAEEGRRTMRVAQFHACQHLLSFESAFKYPMVLISLSRLRSLGRLCTHEELREKGLLTFLDTPPHAYQFACSRHICFVSHQWTGWDHPDPRGVQYAALIAALDALVALGKRGGTQLANGVGVKLGADSTLPAGASDELYVWLDLCSIPQLSPTMQQAAISSLPYYSQMAHSMVILAPKTTHFNTGEQCGLESYAARGWCRCEVFSKLVRGAESIYLADERLLQRGGQLVPIAAAVTKPEEEPAEDPGLRRSAMVRVATANGLRTSFCLMPREQQASQSTATSATLPVPGLSGVRSYDPSPPAGRRQMTGARSTELSPSPRRRHQSGVRSNEPSPAAGRRHKPLRVSINVGDAPPRAGASAAETHGAGLCALEHAIAERAPKSQPPPLTTAPSAHEAQELSSMLFVFEGRFTCCDRGHVVNGQRIPCDKRRLKGVMLKMYGTLLSQGDALPMSEALLEQAERVWPAEVFDEGETDAMRALCSGEALTSARGEGSGGRSHPLDSVESAPQGHRGVLRYSSSFWREPRRQGPALSLMSPWSARCCSSQLAPGPHGGSPACESTRHTVSSVPRAVQADVVRMSAASGSEV